MKMFNNEITKPCIAAANFVIIAVNTYNEGKTLREKVFLHTKRLQKILFFSNILYMLENNGKPMFTDDFCAWPSGPVIPSVYDAFMQYQDGDIKPIGDDKCVALTPQMKSVLIRVLEDTNHLDTVDLVLQSQVKGSPWGDVSDEKNAKFKKIINKTAIFNYYSKHGAPYGNRV